MRKRIVAFFMAVVVAFGCVGYRPQKAYAFAPAAVPIVISLLGLAGIFVTGVTSTTDLYDKMNDFVMSDDEIYDFVNELVSEYVGTSIFLSAVRTAFLANHFIDYARSYFSSAGSDTFSEGMIFRSFEELESLVVPVTVPFSYDGGFYSYSGNKLFNDLGDSIYETEIKNQILPISPIPCYAFLIYDYQLTYVRMGAAVTTSFGFSEDYPHFGLGIGKNHSYITLGNVTYMTPTYAERKGYSLTSGYIVDDSVNVSAIKASILEAETATFNPVKKEIGIYDFTSILDVYDGALICGVTLNPDAVIDPTLPVDPSIPGDLTGISGFLQKILNLLKGLAVAIGVAVVGTGTLDFSKFNEIKLSGLFPFCIPFDLINVFKSFNGVQPIEPKWTIDLAGTPLKAGGKIELDLTQFGVWISIIRYFCYASFVVGLIVITRKVIKG